jgi:prepilin-type N-terminal cleavage/methylation domain-containing protein
MILRDWSNERFVSGGKFDKGASLRNGAKRQRKGFTLVEVIVVLVILAILAAIAIPALTGYIDRAEEKQYIAEARTHMTAIRSVLAEAYADGEILSTPGAVSYIAKGNNPDDESYVKRSWSLVALGTNIFGNAGRYTYMERAAALIGEPFPAKGFDTTNTAYWTIGLFSSKQSTDNMLSAGGFTYQVYPEGNASGKEAVLVTYKLPRLDTSKMTTWGDYAFLTTATQYQADAGYEVYHLDATTTRVSSK